MARNRHIYQSDAIFVSDGTIPPTATHPSGNIKQLHRVQSANYGATFNRVDVNQFGQLARIDSLVLDTPTVSLDFEYFIHNGYNENCLGFTVGSDFSKSFISGIIVTNPTLNTGAAGALSGRNFFILSSPEGTDANYQNITGSGASSQVNGIIAIGNGYITNYEMSASVGAIPTASVTIEGNNGRCIANVSNTGRIPSVGSNGVESTNNFTLPPTTTGAVGVTALRPGDIILTLGDSAIFTDLNDFDAGTAAHIQSFSISVPIGRSVLQRLGSNFGYAREIDFPISVDVSISALLADLKSGSVIQTLTGNAKHTLTIYLRDSAGTDKIAYQVKGAQIVSENFSSSIGANKTVDINFTAQIGGPNDTSNGLFVGGSL